jgi:hypothetical protein
MKIVLVHGNINDMNTDKQEKRLFKKKKRGGGGE